MFITILLIISSIPIIETKRYINPKSKIPVAPLDITKSISSLNTTEKL